MKKVKILEECQYLKDGEVLDLKPGDTIELDDQRAYKWCKAKRAEAIECKAKTDGECTDDCGDSNNTEPENTPKAKPKAKTNKTKK